MARERRPPDFIAGCPDPEKGGRLTRVGAAWLGKSGRGYALRIDRSKKARALAARNLDRIILWPNEGPPGAPPPEEAYLCAADEYGL